MRTVLFVCVENTFRSVLSEALFNATTPAEWRAESAGVQAASSINPVVPELLREIGIELGPKTPRTVTPEITPGEPGRHVWMSRPMPDRRSREGGGLADPGRDRQDAGGAARDSGRTPSPRGRALCSSRSVHCVRKVRVSKG